MEKKYYYFDEKNGTYPFFKSTYMIANVKLKHMKNITMSDYNDGDYVLGLCVPKVCNSTEFKALFFQVENLMSQVLHVNKDEDLEVTLLDNENESSKFNWSDSFYLFIWGIEMSFILIVLFNFVPFSVLKCFFKNNRKSTGRQSSMITIIQLGLAGQQGLTPQMNHPVSPMEGTINNYLKNSKIASIKEKTPMSYLHQC